MTAERLVSACEAAGLRCISQEIVNWGGPLLSDCFSSFCRPASRWATPLQRVENPHFMEEADRVRALAALYGLSASSDRDPGQSDPSRDEAVAAPSRKHSRLRSLLRLLSPSGPAR